MKILFYISCVFLTISCSFLPNSCPTLNDIIIGRIETENNIILPEEYQIIEEKHTTESKTNLYNSSIKLNHHDLILFIKKNKMLPQDTIKYGVFQPSTFELIEIPNISTLFYLTVPNQLDLLVDTVNDKLYISKYF